MFGFGKKSELNVYAPVAGKLIPLAEVADEAFSQKMLGDGFAVEPTENELVAPCDGTVTMVADTRHSLVLETEGVQLLMHIGIDTVEMAGEGFATHVAPQQKVRRGDSLITFDRALIAAKGKPATVVLTVVNAEEAVAAMSMDLSGVGAVLHICVV